MDDQVQAVATGKKMGDDFRERKLTLPVIKAISKADSEENAFWKRTIEKGQQDQGDLETALALLNKHGALTDTRDEAIEWAAKSTAAIASLPDHPVKQMLIDLADYVVERIN